MLLRVFTLAVCAVSLFAQDYRAKVQGLVTDSSDAIVPGAKVTLQNNGTGIVTVRESGANGAYLFDSVEPGTYTVSAELQGFSQQIHENVLVQTRGDVTVNFIIKTRRHCGNDDCDCDRLSRLQFNTQHPRTDCRSQNADGIARKGAQPVHAGAARSGGCQSIYFARRNPFFMWSSSMIDVGGNTSQKNDLLIDGAPTQIGPKGSYSPPMDAVQEFSVQQNSVDAEFGHSAGGTLSVARRSRAPTRFMALPTTSAEPEVQCRGEPDQPHAEFRPESHLGRHRRRAGQEEQIIHVLHLRRMADQGTEGHGPNHADRSRAHRRLLEVAEPGGRVADDLRPDYDSS